MSPRHFTFALARRAAPVDQEQCGITDRSKGYWTSNAADVTVSTIAGSDRLPKPSSPPRCVGVWCNYFNVDCQEELMPLFNLMAWQTVIILHGNVQAYFLT
ncbi:hypothetical protein J6590_039615 [Homalodisca vitripennis]|nr:hypothetical protein J6590_039615 [Homalodisca vitripennis]